MDHSFDAHPFCGPPAPAYLHLLRVACHGVLLALLLPLSRPPLPKVRMPYCRCTARAFSDVSPSFAAATCCAGTTWTQTFSMCWPRMWVFHVLLFSPPCVCKHRFSHFAAPYMVSHMLACWPHTRALHALCVSPDT